jgi:general secretion pathway protein G
MKQKFTIDGFIQYQLFGAGFTLIELLVVISIIGILIGLSVFGLQGAREASRDAKRKADLEEIRSGLELYKSDCGSYPLTGAVTSGLSLVGQAGSVTECSGNTYISLIPSDPTSPSRSYSYVSAGVTYILCASLEQAPSPVMNVTGCGSCTISTGCNYRVIQP